tara:strand:- start:398 stop:958 length:561 start_codon:yes stop_codon:yes gene_type:complete
MSKTLNLAGTASVQRESLLTATDTTINSATNRRASNNISANKISITNYHASNAVKVSLYIEAIGSGIVTVLAADYQASGDATVTHTSNTAVKAGMEVISDLSGVPADSFVALVTSATEFELNANTTVDRAGTATLTLTQKHYIINDVEIPVGATLVLDDKITFNVKTHKLIILKTNANTRITVIID